MLVYTTNIEVKEKLLSKGEVLVTERRVKNITYFFFRLSNPSIVQFFSHNDIVVCNNNLFL
jgi:hypothetical protein